MVGWARQAIVRPRGFDVMTSVIVAGARTPIGRFMGALEGCSATDLGGVAIRGALERSLLTGNQIDYVVMGQVVLAGSGQNPARSAATKAGIPLDVPAITINKVCLSGLNAIALADQLIRLGEHEIVVAGGMESMSNAPYLVTDLRKGHKYGDTTLVDALAFDGLWDQLTDQAMGILVERRNQDIDGLSRGEQDAFSARSHQRAEHATSNGRFDDEIVPMTLASRNGELVMSSDEGIRQGLTIEALADLRPAFSKSGTITAGSSSQISDGAAAVVIMSKGKAEALGLTWLAEIGASGQVAGPDSTLQSQPASAIKQAAKKHGIAISDIDLFEINEAFAAVCIQSRNELGISDDIMNVNGGAIAIGHPVGMSGARIVLTLAHQLKRDGGGIGAAALCGGGGQGEALIITVPGR